MLESSEIANSSHPANATSNVGLEVIPERFRGLEPLIVKTGIEAGVRDFADFLD